LLGSKLFGDTPHRIVAVAPVYRRRCQVNETSRRGNRFFYKPKTRVMKAPKLKGKCGVPVGYLGVADVQALLNKCKTTIWNMVNDGRLPKPLRDGKLRIWDEKELKRWIDNAKFCK
jgi:predicted DNA-binding transcriptional regulator AlpA